MDKTEDISLRDAVIVFIKENDPDLKEERFESYSLGLLVALKTQIELRGKELAIPKKEGK